MGKNMSPRPPPLHPQRGRDSWKDVWQEIAEEGSTDLVKTWTQQGTSSSRVEWQKALGYGQRLYEDIIQRPHHKTESGNCEVAILYAWYKDKTDSSTGTMIFMSTIPRGHTQNDALGRLAGPTGGHPEWRKHCWAEYFKPVWRSPDGPPKYYTPKMQDYATHIHAVDNAINLYLNAKDTYPDLTWNGTHMVIYGLDKRDPFGFGTRILPKPPGQLTPCEEYEEDAWDDEESCSDDEQSRSANRETCLDEGNVQVSFEKAPCCAGVMDKMGIRYDYGEAEMSGGSGGHGIMWEKYYCYFDRLPAARGSGCGGGGKYHTAKNHHHGSFNEHNGASLSSARRKEKRDSESANTAARRRPADTASATGTTPRTQGGVSHDVRTVGTTPAPPNGNNTRSVPVAVKQPRAASLNRSLATRPPVSKTAPAPPVSVSSPLQAQSRHGASVSKEQQGKAPVTSNKTPAIQSRPAARHTPSPEATTPAAARPSAPVQQHGTQGSVPSARIENRPSAPARQDSGHPVGAVNKGRPVPASSRIPRATTTQRQT